MSRGAIVWRSNVSVIGIGMGSSDIEPPAKIKRPDLVRQTGPPDDYSSAPDGLSDLARARTAHDRFHLIFETKFHLLETMLLHLFIRGQVRKRLQLIQFPGMFGVLGGQTTILLVGRH